MVWEAELSFGERWKIWIFEKDGKKFWIKRLNDSGLEEDQLAWEWLLPLGKYGEASAMHEDCNVLSP